MAAQGGEITGFYEKKIKEQDANGEKMSPWLRIEPALVLSYAVLLGRTEPAGSESIPALQRAQLRANSITCVCAWFAWLVRQNQDDKSP